MLCACCCRCWLGPLHDGVGLMMAWPALEAVSLQPYDLGQLGELMHPSMVQHKAIQCQDLHLDPRAGQPWVNPPWFRKRCKARARKVHASCSENLGLLLDRRPRAPAQAL